MRGSTLAIGFALALSCRCAGQDVDLTVSPAPSSETAPAAAALIAASSTSACDAASAIAMAAPARVLGVLPNYATVERHDPAWPISHCGMAGLWDGEVKMPGSQEGAEVGTFCKRAISPPRNPSISPYFLDALRRLSAS